MPDAIARLKSSSILHLAGGSFGAALFWPFSKWNFLFFFLLAVASEVLYPHARRAFDWILLALGMIFIGASLSLDVPNIAWTYESPHGFANELADSFLSGRLDLKAPVHPKLLELADPYAPESHAEVPYNYDASYYKGHYYLYWGIAPILTFTFPFRLLTGRFVGEVPMMLLFTALLMLSAYLTTLKLLAIHQRHEADGLQRFLILIALIFSGAWAVSARHAILYELAILVGLAYFFTALRLALPSRLEKPWHSIVAGVFFGLAVATRPSHAFAFLLFVAIYASAGRWHALKRFVLSIVPIAILVMIYNYARFENPLEFGLRYQLNTLDMMHWGFNWKDLYFATSAFLFEYPTLTKLFPYVELHPFHWSFDVYTHRYSNDGVYGLVYLAPIAVLGLVSQVRSFRERQWPLLFWTFVTVVLCFWILDGMAGDCVRYQMELFTLLLAPTLAAALALRRWNWLIVALVIYGANLGFFASFTFEKDGYRPHFVGLHEDIKNLYR